MSRDMRRSPLNAGRKIRKAKKLPPVMLLYLSPRHLDTRSKHNMADNSGFSDADLHTLADLSIYNCRRFGPYTAIIYEDQGDVREYTNMDIAREAAQLAAGLQALGVQKGDRVIVMM